MSATAIRPHHPGPKCHFRLLSAILSLIAVTALAGCHSSREATGRAEVSPTELTVFAAASLTESFTEIARAFEAANPGVEVVLNFAGSQQLAAQLDEGAQADVFASANPDKMAAVVTGGRIDAAAPVVFCQNRLVIITPADNPGQVQSLTDLARPGLKLVLAGEQVPVGNYSRQMLELAAADHDYGAGFPGAVLANVVSSEETVKLVVAKVQLGEADAGIVYTSDVTPAVADALLDVQIPDSFNIVADYPVAALNDAPAPELAAELISFLLSPDGQDILTRWGFVPVH